MKSAQLALALAVAADAKNIVELAEDTPQLSTLVTAVVAADLVDALSAPGSLTVFAPTNDAFAALPAGVLDDLLKPENKAALQDVLTYHVLTQEFKYADSAGHVASYAGETCDPRGSPAGFYDTLSHKPLSIAGAGVGASGAPQPVSQSNIEADNGLIHIIEGVMLPSLVETGRVVNLTSYNDGHSSDLPFGNCQEKYRKGQVDIQEGKCYNRKFDGDQVKSNDQRAYCKCKPGYGSDCGSYEVVALQYQSTDGSCTNPRPREDVCGFSQGSNEFPSGIVGQPDSYVCIDRFGEILVFQCPNGEATQVVV